MSLYQWKNICFWGLSSHEWSHYLIGWVIFVIQCVTLMENFFFTGNCCIFVNLGWRTLPTQIKRKVQIFLRLCCCCVHTLHQLNLRIAFLFSNFFLFGQGLTLLVFARNWAITWLSIWSVKFEKIVSEFYDLCLVHRALLIYKKQTHVELSAIRMLRYVHN